MTHEAEAGSPAGRPQDDDQEIIDRFHVLWYEGRQRSTWRNTSWMGVPAQQCPCDLWVYQELVSQLRPECVVEVGVKLGGTTLYFAHLLDQVWGKDLEHGRVVGVDISMRADARVRDHPRVTLVEGDSVSDETFERVRALAGTGALVLLDSNHSCEHVLSELRRYADLIPENGYLIVSDTNIAGHPALPQKENGPYEAVARFLAEDRRFAVDPDCEKHMLTLSPGGYLTRVGESRSPS
jgi:cephalosporin hydroxylase